MMYYYTDKNKQPQGPVSREQILALLASGAIDRSSLVVPQGGQEWQSISVLLEQTSAAPVTQVASDRSQPAPAAAPREITAASKTPTSATWSFICGLLGLCCCGLCAIAALICGYRALSTIKQNPGYTGRNLAVAGIWLGYIALVFWLLSVLYFTFTGYGFRHLW